MLSSGKKTCLTNHYYCCEFDIHWVPYYYEIVLHTKLTLLETHFKVEMIAFHWWKVDIFFLGN